MELQTAVEFFQQKTSANKGGCAKNRKKEDKEEKKISPHP